MDSGLIREVGVNGKEERASNCHAMQGIASMESKCPRIAYHRRNNDGQNYRRPAVRRRVDK